MKTGYFTATVYAVLLHIILFGLLTLSFGWRHFSEAAAAPPVLAIQATVVDEQLIAAELDKLAEADERRDRIAKQEQQKLEVEAQKARDARIKEQQRLAQIEQERIAAEARAESESADRASKLRETEQARIAEERRLADVTEQRRKAEAAEQKRAAEALAAQRAKAAAEAEQQRKDEAAKKETQRLAAIEQQRQRADAEKKAELQEQLQRALAEESARRDAEESGLLDEYRTLIAQRIVRNWNQPPGAGSGLKCVVLLSQIPGGEVTDVQIESCNGDAAVVRSIEAAVFKASPLPPPPDPRLFERKVRVLFEPDK